MHIHVVAATKFEIQPAASFFESESFQINHANISFGISGIGLMSATYFLATQIQTQKPGIVIQAGIAGCFENDKNNTLVAIKQDVAADIGVFENNTFKNIFDLKLADQNEWPFTNGVLVNPREKLLALTGMAQVNAISINEISTDKTKIEWYQQKYSPFVESMEGAALHFVCLNEKIPFLQLRCVSNQIGERDKSKWTIKESINTLNNGLIETIKKISTHDETYFRI